MIKQGLLGIAKRHRGVNQVVYGVVIPPHDVIVKKESQGVAIAPHDVYNRLEGVAKPHRDFKKTSPLRKFLERRRTHARPLPLDS